MLNRISDTFSLNHQDLVEAGVLDSFIDVDSRFHIDPYLLSSIEIPELSDCYEKIQDHFRKIITILDASQKKEDRCWREAVRLLCFHEIPQLGLGYSKSGKSSSAIGENIANKLTETAKEIINAGIKDPVIFELIGLFEEGIGADRISDMTASLILRNLLHFTDRLTRQFSISSKIIKFEKIDYLMPKNPKNGRSIILIPKDILSPLPTAYSWDDIDLVCSHNQQLRDRVNQIIGNTWKDATNRKKISKRELKSILLNEPEVFQDLINCYKKKLVKRYDFDNDPVGESIWFDLAIQYTKEFPFKSPVDGIVNNENIFYIVKAICHKYSELIESNGLFKMLYNDEGNLRHERFAQLLFYGIADSYCEANNLDLTRECDGGRGPVDFKVSTGYYSRVLVEIKYSTNTHLVNGFTSQLPIYNKAERTQYSIYLIIKTSDSDNSLEKVRKLKNDAETKNQRVPEIIVIDGRFQKPASIKTKK
jgi:hypothetical protein